MTTFQVPTREEVSEGNQAIFDTLESKLGFVPNLYAVLGKSDNALGSFLTFSGAETSFSNREKEVIDLAVSNVNNCSYCQAAHTAIAKMNGFTDEQTVELRQGKASWDSKLDALAKISKAIAINRGIVDAPTFEAFYQAGYTEVNLVDLVTAVGAITVTNLLHNLTEVPVDFPAPPALN